MSSRGEDFMKRHRYKRVSIHSVITEGRGVLADIPGLMKFIRGEMVRFPLLGGRQEPRGNRRAPRGERTEGPRWRTLGPW